MLNRIWIIAFILLANAGYAQQFHFKNYSLEQGLPRVGVYAIHQDQYGYLWIGTEGGGICTFDGKKFTSYTRHNGIPSDDVRLIFEDNDHTLWFATADGVCYFDEGRFHTITLPDSISDEVFRSIAQDKEGRLWLGSKNGLSFVDTKSKKLDSTFQVKDTLPNNTIRTLLSIEDAMLIGTDSGLFKYQNHRITPFELQSELNGKSILALFLDSKKNLWIGTQNGLNKFDGQQVQKWSIQDGLVSARVRTIVEDHYGNIWVGTSAGISIFDNNEFITITAENGLSNERIRCMFIDRFDNIWIGTFFGGIMRYNYKDFTGFTTHEGLASNQVQSISEDEYGDILVGTNNGFSHLEILNNKLYNYSTIKLSQGYLGNSVKAIYYDESGFTWLGTNEGITLLRGDERKGIIFPRTPDNEIVAVNTIKRINNKYWIGTTHGLYNVKVKGDYESFEIINLSENNDFIGSNVSTIVEDFEKRIWVGFENGTMALYDKTQIINLMLPDNVQHIISIAIDSTGTLWIGTNGNGLFFGKYDPLTKKLNLENLSVNDNLSSNYIYSILIAGKDIWVGHEKGIDLLLGAVDSIENVIHCGIETGFAGLQNFHNASYQDAHGNLWFGTINGLYRLSGRELKSFASGKSSTTYIKNIKINSHQVDWQNSEWADSTSGLFNLPVNLNLPYNKNNIDFEFIGLNFIAPEKIKYSWMLEGFDKRWNAPSYDQHVSYTNLSPGKYIFRLKASNDLGLIQEQEVVFSFTINKPFWETWTFRIFAGLLIFALSILIMRMRTRQLRNKQKALEAIIEARTVEIKSQNEVLEEKNKEITDSIFYSRRIQRSMLPAKEKVAKLFDRYFIFFRPKDIVSGDFYWAERSLDKSKIFFAVADCTGHGVPGAMVSLIGARALNGAVREAGITQTNEILDHVNEGMIASFTDVTTDSVIKDGMDISLCSLDYTNENSIQLQYSGAQNSIWIVRQENDENIVVNGNVLEPNIQFCGYKLFEVKADKQPIGYFEHSFPFTSKEAILKKGDRIYLYSDGFADQFGGEKGKKFKYKTLKELILSIQDKNINDHYSDIRTSFYDWKREFEQIDDVCIMGVEV